VSVDGRVIDPRVERRRPFCPIIDPMTASPEPGRLLNPLDPAFAADPYPAYAVAREAAAAFRQPGDHLTYLTRYADVHAGFRDRRLGSTFLHRYTAEELGLDPGIPVWRDPRRLEVALHGRRA
jgi:hypothetical protein